MAGNEFVDISVIPAGTYDTSTFTDISTLSMGLFLPGEFENPFASIVNEFFAYQVKDYASSLDSFELIEPTTSTAPSVSTITYRLRGYYIAGSSYEFWIGSSTSTPNPSGNPLVNVVIDSIIKTY